MALHATSSLQNVKTSVEKYLYDNLVTTEGLNVHWEGLPFESGATTVVGWLQPRLINFLDPTWKPKASSSTRGNVASVLLNTNIFVKRDFTTYTNEHYRLRDKVITYLYSGVSFPLRDYAGGTTVPRTTLIYVDDITTDTPVPNEDYWQYNITVELKWIREWSD